MSISLFLFFLFLRLFAEIGGSQHKCKVSRCSKEGPDIRFPFRLKDQPVHCGYPGFELSCREKKLTILELPNSVKLLVVDISYKSQQIHFQNLDSCQQRQPPNFNLSSSPFKFTNKSSWTIFNCPSSKTDSDMLQYNSCSFLPVGPVYIVISSQKDFWGWNLSSCRKIWEASLSVFISPKRGASFSLSWSKPECGKCEGGGKICRLKKNHNSKEPEIRCIDKQAEDALNKLKVTGVILGFLLIPLLAFMLYYVYTRDKLEREHRIKIEKFLEDYRALNPSRYSYADIKKITTQFKEKLSQGAYGTVYKGKLSNEVLVAVKILNDSKGNGEDFTNEVQTMCRIHHVNVVRLVGFCADGYKRALIYEFLPNESLEKFIFPSSVKNNSLCWQKLQDIAIGIAKGIEYLHQGCDQRILHFDIKPQNILLDHNFHPKISDFGLAKLCSKEQSAVSVTAARGTMGYIAPEVLSRNFGNVSHKSDVYSFGMLLLEMVGGRKNIDVTVADAGQVYFPEWIYNHLEHGGEVHIRIEEDEDPKIAKKLSIVGLWCIQWHPIDRPSMKVVVKMLEGEDILIVPPNPLSNTTTSPTRTNVRNGRGSHEQELDIISEIE